MIEAVGGRKFVGFVLVSLMLFALVYVGRIDPAEFINFITINFGIYGITNTASKFS